MGGKGLGKASLDGRWSGGKTVRGKAPTEVRGTRRVQQREDIKGKGGSGREHPWGKGIEGELLSSMERTGPHRKRVKNLSGGDRRKKREVQVGKLLIRRGKKRSQTNRGSATERAKKPAVTVSASLRYARVVLERAPWRAFGEADFGEERSG